MSNKFYITTPIYFPSGNWHIGTCYSTVLSDTLARFHKMQGKDVYFLTGTDEHGQKIQKNAESAGLTPKAYIDPIVANLKQIWALLHVDYDKFIRTTDKEHTTSVQEIFTRLYKKGEIYLGKYEGYYCVPCETNFTESQLKEGNCPDCERAVDKRSEEAYFFKLSKYQDALIKLLTDNPDFLEPAGRRNEMLSFLQNGLQDLCVTRPKSSLSWGIGVPFDENHVIYVWIDALFNYTTALGFASKNQKLYDKFWPADVHIMAKEIVRFHSIIWPAMLLALDMPLPKKVYAHGWLNFGGEKMSKSRGNTADPNFFVKNHGADATRYALLKKGPIDKDTDFVYEEFVSTMNIDLANNYGNLTSRTIKLIENGFEGKIPAPDKTGEEDLVVVEAANALLKKVEKAITALKIPKAIDEIMSVLSLANSYIEKTVLWNLVKTDKPRAATVLYNLTEILRITSVCLLPFMPNAPQKVFAKLGITDKKLTSFESLAVGKMKAGNKVEKGESLFERFAIIDAPEPAKKQEKQPEKEQKMQEYITIDDFIKVELKAAKVLECAKVEGADKLLNLTLDAGEEEPRTVLSGIAEHYKPEELIGKTVTLVANLAPRKMRGIFSHGMILCADEGDKVIVVSPASDVSPGATVR